MSRPGEIDPNAETKPARPDPIDMDEDGKIKCFLETQTGKTLDLHCLSRPGEIDSHAETKPARPDPIDMDEDGKMLVRIAIREDPDQTDSSEAVSELSLGF